MRAPFQEGELPRPGEVRLPQRRGRRGRTRRPARSHRLLPVPPPDVVRRAGRGGRSWCRTACRLVAPCWPAPSRPPSTRCGTPRPLVGDRVAVVGAGMVGCCVARLLARHPRRRGDPGRHVDAERAETAAALGVGFALPHDAAGDLDLVVHTSGTAAGLQLRPRPPRRRRRRHRPQPGTATRRSRSTSAAASTPRDSGSGPARSARSPRPGAVASHAEPTGCGWRCACSPTRRTTRC